MYAQLVGAARAGVEFNIGKSVFALQHFIAGDGHAPDIRRFDFAARHAPDRHVNGAFVVRHFAAGDGMIGFVHVAVGKQRHHFGLEFRVLGHQHHAAGFAVQPVHEARARGGRVKAFGRVGENDGHQRLFRRENGFRMFFPHRALRVHKHTGGFYQYKKIFCVVDN